MRRTQQDGLALARPFSLPYGVYNTRGHRSGHGVNIAL
jgi:hypothetical protein